MKILYLTTVSRTINAFLIPHIKMLIDKGNTVDCACSFDKEPDSFLSGQGVRVYNIPFSRNPLNPGNIKALKALIRLQKENNYDLIHVHTPVAALYGRLLKLRFPKLKTVYTVHGFHFHKGASLKNWAVYYPVESVMAGFTDVIITINEEDYERAVKFGAKETYKVDGVGVDLSMYNPALYDRRKLRKGFSLNQYDFVILMIAEVNENKNHEQLIDAVEILKQQGINVKVLCAGDGIWLEQVRKKIREAGLNENIRMLGFRKDIRELIAACDIGILLSFREGLPKNIMELMSFGKPVIGTNIRGIKDMVKDGENGFLVALNDAGETADKIELLFRDRRLLRRLSENAFESVRKYDVSRVLAELENIYSEI